MHVTSPLVEVECGGNSVKTENIKNAKKNPNFPNPVITMNVVSLSLSLYRQAISYYGTWVLIGY